MHVEKNKGIVLFSSSVHSSEGGQGFYVVIPFLGQ